MKESVQNMNTYMAHDCASGLTTFSVDPVPAPISETTNDKTPKTCGIKTYHNALLDSK